MWTGDQLGRIPLLLINIRYTGYLVLACICGLLKIGSTRKKVGCITFYFHKWLNSWMITGVPRFFLVRTSLGRSWTNQGCRGWNSRSPTPWLAIRSIKQSIQCEHPRWATHCLQLAIVNHANTGCNHRLKRNYGLGRCSVLTICSKNFTAERYMTKLCHQIIVWIDTNKLPNLS